MLEHDSNNAPSVRTKFVVNAQHKKLIYKAYEEALTVVSMLKFLQVGMDKESSTIADDKICPSGDGYYMIESILEKANNAIVLIDEIECLAVVEEKEAFDHNTELFKKYLAKHKESQYKTVEQARELKRENKKLRALLSTKQYEHTISGSIGAVFTGGAS